MILRRTPEEPPPTADCRRGVGAQAYRLRRKRVLRAERRRASQKLEQVAAVRGVRQLTERSLVRQPALSVRVFVWGF